MADFELRLPGVMNVQECSWGERELGGGCIRPETRQFWHFCWGEKQLRCVCEVQSPLQQKPRRHGDKGTPGSSSEAVLPLIWWFCPPFPVPPSRFNMSWTCVSPLRNAEIHPEGVASVEFVCSLHVCVDISSYLNVIAHVNLSADDWSHLTDAFLEFLPSDDAEFSPQQSPRVECSLSPPPPLASFSFLLLPPVSCVFDRIGRTYVR